MHDGVMRRTVAFTKAQAKEHDATLAAATTDLNTAIDRVQYCAKAIHRSAGDREQGSRALWTMTLAQAREAAHSVAAGHVEALGAAPGWRLAAAPDRAACALREYDAAMLAVASARLAVDELVEVWRTHGQWSRFFMVTGGHIHSSTSCHSLHVSTQIGWLPDLSGESEAYAVAAYGAVLCSKCFPSAPVAWTTTAPRPADPNECPGSKKYVPGANLRLCSPRGVCPVCGQSISVTRNAKARKHDLPSPDSKEIA